jgi:copper chaperone CopZ
MEILNRRKTMKQNIRLAIPGIKCKGCVAAIEKALGNEIGVDKVEVNLESKTALVESNNSPAVLIEAIREAGFDTMVLLMKERDTQERGLSA